MHIKSETFAYGLFVPYFARISERTTLQSVGKLDCEYIFSDNDENGQISTEYVERNTVLY